jgi:hypothetical protein
MEIYQDMSVQSAVAELQAMHQERKDNTQKERLSGSRCMGEVGRDEKKRKGNKRRWHPIFLIFIN